MQTYRNEMYPPKLIPVLHIPTTPYLFDMWKHADIPKWDVSATHETQCFRDLLHNVSLTCGRMQTCPNEMYCPNQTQCFRALLHNVSLTCGSMQTYWNEIYPPKLIPVFHSPTTPCPFKMWKHADIPKWDVILPYWSQCFKALVYHICLTCGSKQT